MKTKININIGLLLAGNYPPTKVFDRIANLNGHQIINYSADITQNWLLLIGITMVNNKVVGSMQMYSVERNISQPIEGHCGCFSRVTLPGQSTQTTLFSFANKNDAGAKVFIFSYILFTLFFNFFVFTKDFNN